ncbi:hypothetical protein G9A89_013065 [Geosiphon pyriformis]|nr:hypothetical protein G9A89_013065 [Geosiphon pyriformis]
MDQLGYQVNCAVSTRIIMADGTTKTSISEINDFSFKVNNIITSIKVLMIEATQYQALMGNNWLLKTNALKWATHVSTSNDDKKKEKEENIPEETTATEKINSSWKRSYSINNRPEPPYILL